jgi:hypothetical protein
MYVIAGDACVADACRTPGPPGAGTRRWERNDEQGGSMSTKMRLVAVMALAVSAMAVGLATTSDAQAGPRQNLANARLCLRGGWTSLQTSDGRAFRSLGRCVVYALFGGEFGSAAPDTGGEAGGSTDTGGE